MRENSGHALVELIGSLGLITSVLIGAASIIRAEWEWAQCAVLVFEKVHAQLTHSPDPYPQSRHPVWIKNLGTHLQGEARCGSAHETLSLPQLESTEW